MIRPGLHLVHKPVGVTSHAVAREWMGKLKVCHGGTLDPFAEGLLLILSGSATHLFEYLHDAPKQYLATVAWGVETDTGDGLGKPIRSGDAGALTPTRLDAALAPFFGWSEQVPPATSAKKVDGEPAYKKAHRGEAVLLEPSRVFLQDARWTRHALPNSSELTLTCRGGFYVRALARDLGRAVGCGAHLTALRRTTIGPWEDPCAETRRIAGRQMLPWAPARELSRADVLALGRGEALEAAELVPPSWRFPAGFPDPAPLVLGLRNGGVIALLRREGDALQLAKRFPNAV